MKKLLVTLTLLTAALLGLPGGTATAAPKDPESPYGFCNGAWQAPHGADAARCRAKGWVVRSHFVRDPRGVVRHIDLDYCSFEKRDNCLRLRLDDTGVARLQGRIFPFHLPRV